MLSLLLACPSGAQEAEPLFVYKGPLKLKPCKAAGPESKMAKETASLPAANKPLAAPVKKVAVVPERNVIPVSVPSSKKTATLSTPVRSAHPATAPSSKRTAAICAPIKKAAASLKEMAHAGATALGGRLARVTAYWSGEGDYYTRRHMSSTGIHLHQGHCAVDPRIIPYGSVVQIAGVGTYLAVDTGTAVVSRQAAREAGHNAGERSALVIDLFFENRKDGEQFAATGPKYAAITWWKPLIAGDTEANPHSLLADGNASSPNGRTL